MGLIAVLLEWDASTSKSQWREGKSLKRCFEKCHWSWRRLQVVERVSSMRPCALLLPNVKERKRKSKININKFHWEPGVIMYACSPSSRVLEAGGFWVWGQPEQHNETSSQKLMLLGILLAWPGCQESCIFILTLWSKWLCEFWKSLSFFWGSVFRSLRWGWFYLLS
jgi:hypothetical protein